MCLCRAAMIQIAHAISDDHWKCANECMECNAMHVVRQIEINFTACPLRLCFFPLVYIVHFCFIHFITFWLTSSVWSVYMLAILYEHSFVCDLSVYVLKLCSAVTFNAIQWWLCIYVGYILWGIAVSNWISRIPFYACSACTVQLPSAPKADLNHLIVTNCNLFLWMPFITLYDKMRALMLTLDVVIAFLKRF